MFGPRIRQAVSTTRSRSNALRDSSCGFALSHLILFLPAAAAHEPRFATRFARASRAHQFHVTMVIPAVRKASNACRCRRGMHCTRFATSASRVDDFRATDGASQAVGWSARLSIRTRGEPRASAAGTVRVTYAVYWDEPGPFAAQLNIHHAFLNLAMILCYVPDRRGEDDAVHFTDVPADWHAADGFRRAEADPAAAIRALLSAQLRRAGGRSRRIRHIREISSFRAASRRRSTSW